MIKAYLLYTGPDGHSYFKSGLVSENVWSEVHALSFRETKEGSDYDWHTAPATQFVLTLTGQLEFTTSRGEIFILSPGEVLIATDITGKGHKWRMLGNDPWKRAYVKFEIGNNIHFLSDENS